MEREWRDRESDGRQFHAARAAVLVSEEKRGRHAVGEAVPEKISRANRGEWSWRPGLGTSKDIAIRPVWAEWYMQWDSVLHRSRKERYLGWDESSANVTPS
ncbi:hypothetical protein NMY22_g13049 [Coprinellus aureogranulatus]|nr:hypothetical protein NMY22_g13049 [Coprinellus aureogranulatus]